MIKTIQNKALISIAALLFLVVNSVSAITLSKTANGYSAIVTVPELNILQENGYSELDIVGYRSNDNGVGNPGLPQKTVRIAIGPKGVMPTVDVTVLEEKTVSLVSPVAPIQEPWPLHQDIRERPFTLNQEAYNVDKIESPLVSMSQQISIAGVKGVDLLISPVRYNVRGKSVTTVTKFKLDITLPEGSGNFSKINSRAMYPLVKRMYLNYTAQEPVNRKDGYLIITDAKYKDDAKLKEFIEFRKKRFNVTVATVSEAGGNIGGVKSFIREKFPEGVGYVLLVGKAGDIPYEKGSYPTYHNLGKIDNDNYVDVMVGCFFVRSAADLANIVRKTIHAEVNAGKYPKTQTQFSTFASDAHIRDECGLIRDRYWEKGPYKTSWMVPQSSNSEFVQKMKTEFNNNGTSVLQYQGHGLQTAWSDGSGRVTAADVNALTNSEVFPQVWSNACLTGSFHHSSKSFGETWTTTEGGASAFVGASNNSYVYQKMLNAGMACAQSMHEDIKTFGQVFFYGKNFTRDSVHIQNEPGFKQVKNVTLGHETMYNLFGDPALAVKEAPVSVSKGVAALTSHEINVTNISNNRVTLHVGETGLYTMVIRSLQGRTLMTPIRNQNLHAGVHSLSMNQNSLAKGVYFMDIITAGKRHTQKFTVLK